MEIAARGASLGPTSSEKYLRLRRNKYGITDGIETWTPPTIASKHQVVGFLIKGLDQSDNGDLPINIP